MIYLTQCKAFLDAKRKLRLVLSWTSNIPKTFGQIEDAFINITQVALNNNYKLHRTGTNSNESSALNNINKHK